MKRWWTNLAARIDALSLRERVFLFATLLVVSLLLADLLWLGPVQAVHQQLTRRVSAQGVELERLRKELDSSGVQTGPALQAREELAQLRERLAEVNQAIAATPMAAADATPLSRVLAHFLRRHEGLQLVRTATLAPDSRAAAAAAEPVAVRRQGLELTVAGPYAELNRYVQTLEQALPALRWGPMKLTSDGRTAELTLQVWLVGEVP